MYARQIISMTYLSLTVQKLRPIITGKVKVFDATNSHRQGKNECHSEGIKMPCNDVSE